MSEITSTVKKDTFPIVGIGASAGGLEALQEFFDRMSPKTGMAFVVVQHLSPDFESLMVDLLRKRTHMTVQKVNEPTEVKPNHVYLLPRRKDLVIKERTLHPLERDPHIKLNLPIDIFFNSLGDQLHENAVAVILSGSGTDGSRGVRTVKENGGIVFVQRPDSAQFNGMPNAAITLNIADNILRPFEIAGELNRIFGENGKNLRARLCADSTLNDILAGVLEKVKKTSGVDFRLYRQQTLYRRIEKRMSINGIKSPQDYLNYLGNNEDEAHTLFYEFLIGVTAFFRNKEAFESLEKYVIPELFKNKTPHEKVRVWLAGCSTGEEAYSIAILLNEFLEKNDHKHDFKIFASDINKQAIDYASQGIYYSNIAGDVSTSRLEANFIPSGNTAYQIKKKIREKIVFTVHDITKDPPFIKVDLVVCRNMLIYFNPSVQKKLLINFHFALNNNGYLFLGPSETIGGLKNAFSAIDKSWNIFKNVLDVKIAPRRLNSEFQKREKQTRVKPYVENIVKEQFFSQRNTDYFSNILIKEFSPICIFIDKNLNILYINGDLGQIMKFPQRFADLNIRNMMGADESLLFRDGIRKVDEEGKTIFYKNIVFNKDETSFLIDLRFKKFYIKETHADVYLAEVYLKGQALIEEQSEISEQRYQDERLKTLEIELGEARQESQALVEQLETANEELQASNEELLAANEELQSTNEELQSVNEELYTVNTELQTKIEELTIVNNDIDNLLKSTAIGTIFLDNELRIRKFTPAIEEQFSLMETDIGRPISNFTTKLDDKNVYEDAQQVLKTLTSIEREIVAKDEGKTFLMRILPYRTSENIIEGVVLTFVDVQEIVSARQKIMDFSKSLESKVTERTAELEKSNEELARANSYLDSFVFATAHDLRSPVLNLKSFTKLIKRIDSMEQKEQVVEQIGEAVERLSKTLDGLIEMVDFQKNNERSSQELSFSEILKSVKGDLKPQIDECTPHPSITSEFKIETINYIPAFLYSIVYNLVSNAIKYRDFDRPLVIKLSTEALDDYTALHIEDNGIGIELEKYGDELFKPFKRLSIEREGRGIGLSLINEAVAKNGGSIGVKSTLGEGSKFTIHLRRY